MAPSANQLRHLSAEDRITYRKWLRRSVMFYSMLLALLAVGIAANHVFTASREAVQTAAITAGK